MVEIIEILNKPIAEIDAMAKERGLNSSDYRNIKELAKDISKKPIIEEKKVEEPEGETSEGKESGKEAKEEKHEEPEGVPEGVKSEDTESKEPDEGVAVKEDGK